MHLRACVVLCVILMAVAFAAEAAPQLETRLEQMLLDLYGSSEEIQIKIDKLPQKLQQGSAVRNVNLAKVPEPGGTGLAVVEFKGPDGKPGSCYLSFRVFSKKMLAYVKRSLRKGAELTREDLGIRETLITDKGTLYPGHPEELIGRTLVRDVAAGTVITYAMIDSKQGVKRGEVVTIVCDNSKFTVRAKGKAMDSGRRGDTIRVKNIPSEREILAKVIDSGTVAVEF